MTADIFSPEKRSQIMSRVRGYDTEPELLVRSFLFRLGYRFRIHQDKLPGNPDIVLARHKKVIFVHGCFWHGHKGCSRSKRPQAHYSFWKEKLDKNTERDKMQQGELRKLGWKYLVIWQCQIKNFERLQKRIKEFLEK